MTEPTNDESGPKWGINLDGVNCPSCDAKMPGIRVPKGWHELMWGGWTCPECGCRMDKWGKARDEAED